MQPKLAEWQPVVLLVEECLQSARARDDKADLEIKLHYLDPFEEEGAHAVGEIEKLSVRYGVEICCIGRHKGREVRLSAELLAPRRR